MIRLRYLILLALLVCPAPAWSGASDFEGKPAPEFRLQDQSGEWRALNDYRGQWVVLYFYPKDDTPGCTTEACNFRDDIYRFKAKGAAVLGISLDDVASHKEFAEKYELPFPLLADTEEEVARQYGVLTTLGPLKFAKRETFLIDPHGKVARHYTDVDPEEHAQEILAELEQLMATDAV